MCIGGGGSDSPDIQTPAAPFIRPALPTNLLILNQEARQAIQGTGRTVTNQGESQSLSALRIGGVLSNAIP